MLATWWRGAEVDGRGIAVAIRAVYNNEMELQAQQPSSGKAAPPVTRSQQRHIFKKAVRGAPSREMVPRTAVQRACACLWPWVNAAVYPGIRMGLYHLFKGRAAIYTIRDWRRGRRRMPTWARDILIAELEKKMAALGTAIAELKSESGD